MKSKIKTIFLLVIFMSALSARLFAADADVNQAIKDHLAIAQSYEEKAKTYEALTADHEKILKERHENFDKSSYGGSYGTNRWSLGRSGYDFLSPLMLGQMHKHCDGIIKGSKALRKQVLKTAEWHRKQAAELQKTLPAAG